MIVTVTRYRIRLRRSKNEMSVEDAVTAETGYEYSTTNCAQNECTHCLYKTQVILSNTARDCLSTKEKMIKKESSGPSIISSLSEILVVNSVF